MQRGGEGSSEPDGGIDKMFATAAEKDARNTLACSDRNQDRWFDRLNNFVSATRSPKMPGGFRSPRADDDEIVLLDRRFVENLRNWLTRLDHGLALDAHALQHVGFPIESLTERLLLSWVFRDTQKGDPTFDRARHPAAEPDGVVRGRSTVAANKNIHSL